MARLTNFVILAGARLHPPFIVAVADACVYAASAGQRKLAPPGRATTSVTETDSVNKSAPDAELPLSRGRS
jgi:hypothetical protein